MSHNKKKVYYYVLPILSIYDVIVMVALHIFIYINLNFILWFFVGLNIVLTVNKIIKFQFYPHIKSAI